MYQENLANVGHMINLKENKEQMFLNLLNESTVSYKNDIKSLVNLNAQNNEKRLNDSAIERS